jgi:hypothetical protein
MLENNPPEAVATELGALSGPILAGLLELKNASQLLQVEVESLISIVLLSCDSNSSYNVVATTSQGASYNSGIAFDSLDCTTAPLTPEEEFDSRLAIAEQMQDAFTRDLNNCGSSSSGGSGATLSYFGTTRSAAEMNLEATVLLLDPGLFFFFFERREFYLLPERHT